VFHVGSKFDAAAAARALNVARSMLSKRPYLDRHEIGKIYENGIEITDAFSTNHSTLTISLPCGRGRNLSNKLNRPGY